MIFHLAPFPIIIPLWQHGFCVLHRPTLGAFSCQSRSSSSIHRFPSRLKVRFLSLDIGSSASHFGTCSVAFVLTSVRVLLFWLRLCCFYIGFGFVSFVLTIVVLLSLWLRSCCFRFDLRCVALHIWIDSRGEVCGSSNDHPFLREVTSIQAFRQEHVVKDCGADGKPFRSGIPSWANIVVQPVNVT